MELDTAVRHKLPLLCVISLTGPPTPSGRKARYRVRRPSPHRRS
jgi:hypothetical protein